MIHPEGPISLPQVMHNWAEPYRQHPSPLAQAVARSLDELGADAFSMRTYLTEEQLKTGVFFDAMRVIGLRGEDVIGYTLTDPSLSGDQERIMKALIRSSIAQFPDSPFTRRDEKHALALVVRANLHTVAAFAMARIGSQSDDRYYNIFYPDVFLDFDPRMRFFGMAANSAVSLAVHFLKRTPFDTAKTLIF